MTGSRSYMNDEKMEKYVEALLDSLLKLNPQLKAQVSATPKLRMEIKDLLKKKLDPEDKGLAEDVLRQDKLTGILAQYASMAMTALGLKNDTTVMNDIQKMLEPLFKDKDKADSFMKDFKKLFELKLTPKELVQKVEELIKEKFGEKGLQDIKKQMQDIVNKCNEYFKSCNLPVRENTNPMINLTGLLSNEPGSYFVPQDHFSGNGMAFVDMNPNSGIANIDKINSIEENPFGDPLGLVDATIDNFAANESTIVSEFSDQLHEKGFKAKNALTPH